MANMICHFCNKKIKGESFKRKKLSTCHPTILFYEINVCNKCIQKKG